MGFSPEVPTRWRLEEARAHYAAGRYRDAEASARAVLADQPDDPAACDLLGLLALTSGDSSQAIPWLTYAVTLQPHRPVFHNHLGQALQRQKRLPEAIASYQQALALSPDDADTLNNLGTALYDTGNFAEAAATYRQALGIAPGLAHIHFNLGNVLRELKRLGEAIVSYQEAITFRPHYPAALNNLGTLLQRENRIDEAITVYQLALAQDPQNAAIHYNLGTALTELGRRSDAVASHHRALQLKPDYAEPYCALGNVDVETDLDAALRSYQEAVRLKPDYAEAHYNMGRVLADLGRLDDALSSYRRAIDIKPGYVEAHTNAGVVLHDQGHIEAAVASYQQALALDINRAETHTNLGVSLHYLGDLHAALCCYERALMLKPDHAPAHFNMGISLLLDGDFDRGWQEHEWRWQLPTFKRVRPSFAQPMWDGSDLAGKAILLHYEQGFGDTIQFARYIPCVAARAARVVLLCQPELKRLLYDLAGVDDVLPDGEALPTFDVWAPLMSLPFLLGAGSKPQGAPYLRAKSDLVANWAPRLGESHGLRIGITWAGNPTHKRDRQRSMSFADLSPLATCRGLQFFGLQKGHAATQATEPPTDMAFTNLGPLLDDFEDTAAVISQLDLVVSVDTAVAHLAAALGRPTWLLLDHVPDWRWLRAGETTSWYPTVRLFRQERQGNWADVVARVLEAFSTFRPSDDVSQGRDGAR